MILSWTILSVASKRWSIYRFPHLVHYVVYAKLVHLATWSGFFPSTKASIASYHANSFSTYSLKTWVADNRFSLSHESFCLYNCQHYGICFHLSIVGCHGHPVLLGSHDHLRISPTALKTSQLRTKSIKIIVRNILLWCELNYQQQLHTCKLHRMQCYNLLNKISWNERECTHVLAHVSGNLNKELFS